MSFLADWKLGLCAISQRGEFFYIKKTELHYKRPAGLRVRQLAVCLHLHVSLGFKIRLISCSELPPLLQYVPMKKAAQDLLSCSIAA